MKKDKVPKFWKELFALPKVDDEEMKGEETFDTPKIKDFTIKLEFYSHKPNKITYDSRDDK